jgi:hypothetical protein
MKRNVFGGYSTVATFGGPIIVALGKGGKLSLLDLQLRAMTHDMTVSEYVNKFTAPFAYTDEKFNECVHENARMMRRDVYLRETGAN